MKVMFMHSCSGAGQEPAPSGTTLDTQIAASLAVLGPVCEVEVRAPTLYRRMRRVVAHRHRSGSGRWERARDTRTTVLACDRLVTSGWPALAACEEMGIVADVHVMEDFEAPLDGCGGRDGRPDAAGTGRRFELTERSRRILVRRCSDVRRLRAHGRFPWLLFLDGEGRGTAGAGLASVGMEDLSAWVAAAGRSEHAELSVSAALGRAAPRSIHDVAGLLDACLGRLEAGRIQTVNLQHIHLARRSPVFREVIADAPAITADGWPIVRLLQGNGFTEVHRATGADLVAHLLEDPRVRGLGIALVGGAESPGTEFAARARAVGAAVVLREHGDKRDWEPAQLAGRLNDAGANLTLVAVSQPAGDLLAAELVAAGYHGTAIGIGAAVELFVGGERRAAPWVQHLGLEWLFRFAQDPRRLWRRYFVEGVPTYFGVVRPIIRTHAVARAAGLQPLGAS